MLGFDGRVAPLTEASHDGIGINETTGRAMTDFERKTQERIESELVQVKQEILALRQEVRSEELSGTGDNTPLTEEADVAQLVEGLEIQTERQEWAFRRARALEEALDRLEKGTYGVCASCGERIARERLEAMPEASLCTACQSRMETIEEKKRRPKPPRPDEWEESEEIFRRKEEFDG